jgi:hypothetical protein
MRTVRDLHGDSSVTDVTFASGHVCCRYEDGDSDEAYRVSIPTLAVLSQASAEEDTVYTQIIDLKSELPIEPNSQIYIAPPAFGAQMRAAREGFLLAVGLNSNDWPLFLQIRGRQLLIACPVQNEGDIQIDLYGSVAQE